MNMWYDGLPEYDVSAICYWTRDKDYWSQYDIDFSSATYEQYRLHGRTFDEAIEVVKGMIEDNTHQYYILSAFMVKEGDE